MTGAQPAESGNTIGGGTFYAPVIPSREIR